MRADLNLLVVLDAVLRHRSVSRAAEDLSLSQPAVSHALNRLRGQLADPLFLRGKGGLVPTARALALAPGVGALVQAAQALTLPDAFDPSVSSLTFRLAASDYALCALIPPLLSALDIVAPGIRIEAEAAGPATLDRLERGLIDLSFWGTARPTAPFHHRSLFQERYLGVAHRDHPIFAKGTAAVPLDSYLAAKHAVVSFGDPGANEVDRMLRALGATRRIGLVSPSFSGNLAALGTARLVASLPSRLCDALPADLVAFDLPFGIPPYDYGFVWHHRTDAAAAQTWLRALIGRVLQFPQPPLGSLETHTLPNP